MTKIKPIERVFLIGWIILVFFVFLVFRKQINPRGFVGELIKAFLSSLSAGYLQ